MELIYIYIENYRNYNNIEIPISGKFNIKFDMSRNKMFFEKNKEYVDIYPEYITDINVIVGKNSVGKTNLLDLIGMKIDDRNKKSEEMEVIFKKKKGLGYKIPDDIKDIRYYAKYFLVYYMGIKDGKELFCFEGNFVDYINNLLGIKIEHTNYFKSKNWFCVVCSYEKGVLKFEYDINARFGEYKIDSGARIYGDYRTEQDKLAVVFFKEKFNSEIYNRISFKPKDDYKICIPRRICKLNSNLWFEKIKVLIKLLNKDNRTMFSDKEYKLRIKYYKVEDIFLDENEIIKLPKLSDFLSKEDYKKCDIIENINDIVKVKNIEEKNYDAVVEYYKKIYKSILKSFDDEEIYEIAYPQFEEFIKVLNNKKIHIHDGEIIITIDKNTIIEEIEDVIKVLLDAGYEKGVFHNSFSIFYKFFDVYIDRLSDGEFSNLGMYSAIYEQIQNINFMYGKEKFILLFDEPEKNMHPELARNFIKDIINFLGEFSNDRKFQIIISTHSPFILSDVLNYNILLLNKNKEGMCQVEKCKFSTFSANIHDILSKNFFMDYTMGAYSKDIIDKVIKFLYKDDNTLNSEQVKCVISNIGEPILKNKLESRFYELYPEQKNNLYLNIIKKISKEIENIELIDNVSKMDLLKNVELLKKEIEKADVRE